MRYMSLCKLPLYVAVAMLAFCYQGNLNAEKDAEDLEEALMMKLLEKRAKKRTGDDDKPLRLDKSDLKMFETGDKSEISTGVVNDLKGMLKEPFLDVLASSELISWSELAARVNKAKKAMELFEVKYRSELASGGKVAAPAALPGPAVMPGAKQVAAMPAAMPTPATMPAAVPAPAAMPAVMPGTRPTVMPGTKPATKAVAADEEEEEEEEDVKPAARPTMPGVTPVGMPIAQPGGMPGVAPARPTGMPGIGGGMSSAAPVAVMDGMPRA